MIKGPVAISICIVVLNLLIGHFFAPWGLMFTPVVIVTVTTLIAFGLETLKYKWKSLLAFVLIALHDIGMKLYAGGSHDGPGQGWGQMLSLMGLLPAFGMLLIAVLRDKEETIANKSIAIVLFPVLIGIHFYISNNLGLGRYYWYEWND